VNIAVFTDAFYPQVNGVVTSLMNTSRELVRRGHRVVIFAPRPARGQVIEEDFGDIRVVLIPGIKAPYYPDIRITWPANGFVWRELLKMEADILHFHVPFTLGAECLLNARLLKKPVVGSFHTFFGEEEYLKIAGKGHSRFLREVVWGYCLFFYNRCRAVVSPSRYTGEELVRHGLRNPPEIIPNGVHFEETGVLESDVRAVREKYGLTENTALFVGRVSREKSIDILLRAAGKMAESLPDMRLLIVGDGPAMEESRALASELGLGGNVVFAGMIPHAELLKSGIFQASKLFVTASGSENQPMTILEAMLFGLPVVGVNRRGIPEMLDGNGIAVESGDPAAIAEACLSLLNDGELRRRMGERSALLAPRYDIRATTDRMEQLYARLMPEASP
jgi:glycosyltransferase involved in cell wall biosynthesis